MIACEVVIIWRFGCMHVKTNGLDIELYGSRIPQFVSAEYFDHHIKHLPRL